MSRIHRRPVKNVSKECQFRVGELPDFMAYSKTYDNFIWGVIDLVKDHADKFPDRPSWKLLRPIRDEVYRTIQSPTSAKLGAEIRNDLTRVAIALAKRDLTGLKSDGEFPLWGMKFQTVSTEMAPEYGYLVFDKAVMVRDVPEWVFNAKDRISGFTVDTINKVTYHAYCRVIFKKGLRRAEVDEIISGSKVNPSDWGTLDTVEEYFGVEK